MKFDDYNYEKAAGCNKAVDELLGKNSLNILVDKKTTNINDDGTPMRSYWIKP